jgi:hypothetical protein
MGRLIQPDSLSPALGYDQLVRLRGAMGMVVGLLAGSVLLSFTAYSVAYAVKIVGVASLLPTDGQNIHVSVQLETSGADSEISLRMRGGAQTPPGREGVRGLAGPPRERSMDRRSVPSALPALSALDCRPWQ